ncbi:MAG: hypothetical protein K2L78_06165, partial [Muribaculaceae bacterium]|nr:hypothetical protein [Muribaculaceae bacterium]
MRKIFTLTAAITLSIGVMAASGIVLKNNQGNLGPRLQATVKAPARIPGAILGEAPLYDPEGTDEQYVMNVVENDWMGRNECYGYKMTIRRSADGKTIYFRDLTPGYNFDETTGKYAWVKGTINGNDITVPGGQVLFDSQLSDHKVYLEAVTMDEYGQFKDFLPELHFTIDGDIITQTDNSIYLSPYKDGETINEAGFYNFMNEFSIMPIGDIPSFTPPAGTETETWIMTHRAGQNSVKVARDGNTVYLAGLSTTAPDDFVPGTIENGKLTIKSFYILSSNQNYYQRLAGAVEGEPDEFGFTTLTPTESITFDVNPDGSFTLTPANSWIVTCDYFIINMQRGISGAELFAYAGDVPATPATPAILLWS